MRILHVVPTYLPAVRYGGPIFSVHGLARALVRRGHEVHVFTTNEDGPGVSPVPLDKAVDLDGVSVRYFPCAVGRRTFRSPAMGRALARMSTMFDVMHLHCVFVWPTKAAASAAQSAKVPYILAPRGMLVDDLIRRRSKLKKRAWIRLFEVRNVREADAIHVTSEIERTQIENLGLPARRFAMVPNGIDVPPMLVRPMREGTEQRPYILALSRLNWKKGIDRLIRAMLHIPDADLVIAGNDEDGYQSTLEHIARNCGMADRVRFVGPVYGDEKWALISSAHLLALPSYSENFGNVVLEAMACGTPVVVTPEVGLAETVRAAGAGLVVAGEPDALGAAIAGLLADPVRCNAMSAAGRRTAVEMFSWDAVACQIEDAYRQAAAR